MSRAVPASRERPHVIALTGSIGMGKSTTAAMFAEEGVPVWDADAAVARLYAPGGAGGPAVARLHPEAVRPDGAVDREALRARVTADPAALRALEAAIHPLVAADRDAFLASAGAPVVLLDVPLLFETGGEALADTVVVASAPEETQRARVLAREGMTPERLDAILARQAPDAEKRARADHVVETLTMEGARAAVRRILEGLHA
jgi:dephospho-CoA kinase